METVAAEFIIPTETHIGNIHLQVSDLKQSHDFYSHLLGFRPIRQENGTVWLSASGLPPASIILTELSGAWPKTRETTGLYHAAIRVPTRYDLARIFRRLIDENWPVDGLSDHLVSEGIYLTDPDGNGLEIYHDRPREEWPHRNNYIAMDTKPLNPKNLLAVLPEDVPVWEGLPPKTDIGHIHLRISDLARAEFFYQGVLGFEVTQRDYPGALFFAAGGYHHHIAVNVWAGENIPPSPHDAVGLISFAIHVPDEVTYNTLRDRLAAADIPAAEQSSPDYSLSMLINDPDTNGIEIVTGIRR